MRARTAMVVLSLAALCVAAQQGSIFYEDPDKNLSLRDFIKKSLSFNGDRIVFGGTGQPLTVEARSSGLLIQGNAISGEAARSAERADLYVLGKADVTGNAVLIFDSRKQQKYLLEKKLIEQLSPSATKNRFDSASFSYAGTASAGTLTVPSKLRLRSDAEGVQNVVQPDKSVKKKSFTRNLDMTGSSGVVTFFQPVAGSYLMLEGGTVQGPVQFTLNSKEQTEGQAAPSETQITGQADLLTFNFKGENKTITFSGNVRVTGTGNTFAGNASATTVTVTLDETLQPIRYDLSGDPATTRLKPGGGNR